MLHLYFLIWSLKVVRAKGAKRLNRASSAWPGSRAISVSFSSADMPRPNHFEKSAAAVGNS